MNKRPRNLYLIGPMGAGKTCIGQQLAKIARRPFIDTDIEIEQRTGVSVSWIFQVEGEAGFRDRESQLIDELSQQSGLIVATGGGTIIREENRRILKNSGIVVLLTVPFEIQYARTSKRGTERRPLLDDENPKHKLKILNESRETMYRSVADLVYTTHKDTPMMISKKILAESKQIDTHVIDKA